MSLNGGIVNQPTGENEPPRIDPNFSGQMSIISRQCKYNNSSNYDFSLSVIYYSDEPRIFQPRISQARTSSQNQTLHRTARR